MTPPDRQFSDKGGIRRAAAAGRQRILGWTHIEARIITLDAIILGELHKNEMRKDFTASKRVAMGKALEVYLGSRQGQRTDKGLPAKLPKIEHGIQTRAIAAEKVGFGSRTTYRQAKQVVDHAEPEFMDAVDGGALPLSQAAKVVEANPAIQREVADLAQQGKRKEAREVIRNAYKRSARSLLRKAVAEGVIAEKGHNTDVAVETLQEVQGVLEGQAEGLGQPLGRLRPLA